MKVDLDEIENRSTQATAGPWTAEGSIPPFIHNGRSFGVLHANEDDDFLDLDFAAHARTDVPLLVARVRELEAALSRATDALDRDATGLAQALSDVRKSASQRLWVTEGRGPYQWDDDHYKEEAGTALREVIEIAVKGLRESGKIADVEVPTAQLVLGVRALGVQDIGNGQTEAFLVGAAELGDRELDSPLPIEARKRT